jgi:hypothetical protein
VSFDEEELDILQAKLVCIIFGNSLSSPNALSSGYNSITYQVTAAALTGLRRQNSY